MDRFGKLKTAFAITLTGTKYLFLLLLTVNATAQTYLQSHFESFTINDGLSQGYVSSIFQDKIGMMWFATGDGLNKYDGYAFTIYHHNPDDSTSIGSDDLACVFEDSKGRLWVGTRQNGIDLFDREKKTFAHIRHDSNNSLWSDDILSMTEDKTGALWVRTKKGIDRMEMVNGQSSSLLQQGGRLWQQYTILFSHIKLDDIFEAEKNKYGPGDIFIDSRNHIFITTNNRLLELTYNTSRHSYKLFERLRFRVNDSAFIPIMLEDTANDNLLLNVNGISKYTAYDFTSPQVIFHTPANLARSTIDKTQRLWLVDNNRIAQVQLPTDSVERIVPAEPVQLQALTAIIMFFTDRTGVIWIATGGYGVLKYDPEVERFHAMLSNTVIYQLVPGDSGKVINNLFQELTIRKYQAPVVKNIIDSSVIKKSFPKFSVLSFTKDTTGNFWLGIHGGILRYNRNAKTITRIDLPYTGFSTVPFPLYADSINNLWVGYNRYFVRYNIATGKFAKFAYPASAVSYDYDFLQCIYEDNGLLWLGSTNGIFGFNIKEEKWDYLYAHNPGIGYSLSNNFVLSFCRDFKQPKRYLWVGTKGGGLNRLDKTTGNFIQYDTRSGLPNNVVYGILPDSAGNLWLSTNKGLSNFDLTTQHFLNFDVNDGLQSNEFNRYAFLKTKDGLLVFGGMNGLNYFDPDEVKPLPPPGVVFTDFRLFNRTVNLYKRNGTAKTNIEFTNKIVLRYEQNVITLQFAATDYRRQGNIQYRYMMKGFDKDWIYSGPIREATYTNLDPDDYFFIVQARFKNGAWGTGMTSLNIVIITPWWRTWWFYLAVITVISSAIYALYSYRIYQLTRLERLRNQIARDLHDEVGSSISTIAIYSKIAFEQMGSETFNNEPLLKKITDYAAEIMDSMNDIVWNINAKNDAFEHIISRMREHAYQLLETKGYTLHLTFDESLYQTKLAMEKRRDFYLIYKEALNNTAKYANGRNVWIVLTVNHHLFHLTITDDGKGFDAGSVKKGGNGLTNMHYRAAALNGTIQITSKPGEGTKVSLVFSGRK